MQNLCPLRLTNHVTVTIDSAAYALALDALNNNGVASLSRVRKNMLSICLRVTAKGMQVSLAKDLQSLLENLVKGFL